MIVQEHFDVNGRDFIRTVSNVGRYVVRDGVSYSEACDPAEYGRRYTEGDLILEDDLTIEDKTEAYNILMGIES